MERTFSYEFYAVKKDWSNGNQIRGIVEGGTIERIQTQEKESGTITAYYSNEIPDDGRIRIYVHDSLDDTTFPLATLRVAKPRKSISSITGESCELSLSSVLTYASNDCPKSPYVVKKGTNVVNHVKNIFTSLGLKVSAEASSTVLSKTRYYNNDTWLTIANDLLTSSPNYQSAWVDRYGTVMLTPYIEPSDKAAKVTFSDTGDDRVKFIGEIQSDDDWYTVPNRFRLYYSDDTKTYSATAEDKSGTRLSYDSRGYWVTEEDTVDEVDGNIQTYLNNRVKQRLRSAQSNVAAYEFQGQLVRGLELGDNVNFEWTSQEIDVTRTVYSMTYNLDKTLLVDYRIREFLRGEDE